jgi:hypothetical protein
MWYNSPVVVAVTIASFGMRKVRTAQGTVVANSDAEQSDGQCNRKDTAQSPGSLLPGFGNGEMVR